MDLIDKKLICALDQNCRRPVSQIAHDLRIGRNVASYRIKNLEKKGIITKHICSINLGKLGYKTYKIYFKIKNQTKESEQEFSNYLKNCKSIIHCLKNEGSLDYSVTIATKTILELNNFITETKTQFKKIIKDYFVSIIVYSKIFKLNKIILKEKEKIIKIEKYSGEEEKIDIDEKDKIILRLLSQNANLSILDISNKTKLSPDIVKYRIKKLSTSLINSFRAILDLNKLGFHYYTILLKMKENSNVDEEKLINWCMNKKEILYCTKRIGYFDFSINFVVEDIDGLNSILAEFKESFSNIIDSYELLTNTKLLKLNYIPF